VHMKIDPIGQWDQLANKIHLSKNVIGQ